MNLSRRVRGGLLVAGVAPAILLALNPTSVLAGDPGRLDRSFSNDGVAFVDFGRAISVSGVFTGDRGHLIASGYRLSEPAKTMLAGLLRDGRRDFSFGNRGRLVMTAKDRMTEAFIWRDAPDGDMIGLGQYGADGYYLVKVSAQGELDRTFGTGGLFTRKRAGGVPADMAIDERGRAFVVVNTDGGDTLISSHRRNGARDTTFGTRGAARIVGQSFEIVIDTHGRILVPGVRSNRRLVVDAFLADGRRDVRYGTSGRGSITIPSGAEELRSPRAAITAGGGIVLATDIRFNTSLDLVVAKLAANGKPARGFGRGDGWRRIDIGPADVRRDVVALSDGRIIVAGDVSNDLFSDRDTKIFLLGLHSDGTTWTAFGNSGIVRTNFGRAKLVSLADATVVSKTVVVSGGSNGDMFVARFRLE